MKDVAVVTVDPTWTVGAYLVYLAVSVAVTVWVARTLHKNGRLFLVDAFNGNAALADSVNHLLVVGFYLINIGFVALALKSAQKPSDAVTAIEFFSDKQGMVLMVLGVMHLFNVWLFSRFRRQGMRRHEPPPVAPDERIALG